MAKVPASDQEFARITAGTTDPGQMDMLEAADELALLAAAIAYHDRRYHGADDPVISDAVYDQLVARNRDLEAAFPNLMRADGPSERIGTLVAGGLARSGMRGQCCHSTMVSLTRISLICCAHSPVSVAR